MTSGFTLGMNRLHWPLSTHPKRTDAVWKNLSDLLPQYTGLLFFKVTIQGKRVFEDPPGVSWMLYLPHVLTSGQVPEARDLIPLMRDDQQQGTLMASASDAVFHVNNRDHVKTANDIEIRLAGQDLLRRFVDL